MCKACFAGKAIFPEEALNEHGTQRPSSIRPLGSRVPVTTHFTYQRSCNPK